MSRQLGMFEHDLPSDTATGRQCGICGLCKPLSAFGINRAKKDGRNLYCKTCNCSKQQKRALKTKRQYSPPDDMMTKRCPRCEKVKSASEFHRQLSHKSGLADYCRECTCFAVRLRKYGITREQYHELYDAQHGLCSICADKIEIHLTSHVDHCHKTGKIRSILCRSCNTGLSHFHDDPVLMEKAAAYLRHHEGKERLF